MPVAFQPQRLCKSCMLIFDEAGDGAPSTSQLYRKFVKVNKGGSSLRQIERELRAAGTPISYDSLRNHSQYHQDVGNMAARTPFDKVAKVTNEMIASVEKRELHHTDRRSAVLDKLQDLLVKGELKGATYTAMATLLKQESDIEEKQKDRTLEIQKLFASYVGNPLAIPDDGYQDAIAGEVVEPDLTPGT